MKHVEKVHPYLQTHKVRRFELLPINHIAPTPRNGKYTNEQQLAREYFEKTILQIKPFLSKLSVCPLNDVLQYTGQFESGFCLHTYLLVSTKRSAE